MNNTETTEVNSENKNVTPLLDGVMLGWYQIVHLGNLPLPISPKSEIGHSTWDTVNYLVQCKLSPMGDREHLLLACHGAQSCAK